MDKTVRPPSPIALASPAGLVAMQLTQDEIQLLDAFRSMEAARQNACIDAARGLAHAFPRERRTPALHIVPGACRFDGQSAARRTGVGQE